MSALITAAAAAGPLAAGWPLHAWRLRRRIDAARRDPLTGLWTRVPFEERAQRMVDQGWMSMLFIDLDDFKAINDAYGHAAGDAVLREAGARVDRWMHTNGPGVAARLGGDEFAVAVRALSAEELVWSAGELHRALCEPIAHDSRELFAGASVGGVWTPQGAVGYLPVMMRRADEAMYSAKRKGGGVFVTEQLRPQQTTVNGRRAGRSGAGEPTTPREVA